MLKLFISLAAAGFVLITGLISCSQEKKTTDVYRTKTPVIRSGQGSKELKSWDSLKNKDLDLNDQLDFSASAPARIRIRSSCRTDKDDFYGGGEFSGFSVPIWKTLPVELLTASLSTKPFACSFEVDLYNDAGSNHVYTLPPVPVVERTVSESRIAIENTSDDEARPVPPKMQDAKLRFRNSAQAAAKLICEDMELPPLPFEQVLELNHFNFSAPVLRENRQPETLEAKPLQHCRAVILERGLAVSLSNMVLIQMPRRRLIVTAEAPLRLPPESATRLIAGILTGAPATLGEWSVKNPGTVARTLRLSPRGLGLRVWRVVAETLRAYNGVMLYENLKYQLRIEPAAANGMSEMPGEMILTLPPGHSVTVTAKFQTPARPYCAGLLSSFLRMLPLEQGALEELSSEGSVLDSIPLEVQPVEWGIPPDLDRLPKPVHCEWN